mmetsp:Transcript_11863/g.13280  ORF Transcript_11863/g.13280 Transcript_11863/m.13280 type:complete len:132 (+) Transcript_11863:58-453(+)
MLLGRKITGPKLLFGFHSVYEAFAGYTNIINPQVFGKAAGETSVRWQGALGFAQMSLSLLTLSFMNDTGSRTGAKASMVAVTFHALVTSRMLLEHFNGTSAIKPVQFYSHSILCGSFVWHILATWGKSKSQ